MSTDTQKAEAVGDGKVEFTYDGETYTADSSFDLDAVELLQDNKTVAAMRIILGDQQYAKFRKNHRSIDQLDDLYGAYSKAREGNS